MQIPPHFKQDQLLSKLTTFGIGGYARYFVEVRTIHDMQEILQFCHHQNLPFFILGKGSNLLFDDRGFNGVVIANRIDFFTQPEESIFHVGAGYSFSLLGSQTARKGWSGLEFASGIPGSVGGAIFMNAGANGHEACECLLSVDFISNEGELQHLPREALSFSYRTSPFQSMKGAIVGATFKLAPLQSARQKQLEIIQYRTKTQPYSEKSAGCIFRNPVCQAAGALIDNANLKGQAIGGAKVSDKHANFIVNTGTATSQDVLTLIRLVQEKVKEQTGTDLESEVRYIPYQPYADQANE